MNHRAFGSSTVVNIRAICLNCKKEIYLNQNQIVAVRRFEEGIEKFTCTFVCRICGETNITPSNERAFTLLESHGVESLRPSEVTIHIKPDSDERQAPLIERLKESGGEMSDDDLLDLAAKVKTFEEAAALVTYLMLHGHYPSKTCDPNTTSE